MEGFLFFFWYTNNLFATLLTGSIIENISLSLARMHTHTVYHYQKISCQLRTKSNKEYDNILFQLYNTMQILTVFCSSCTV